MIANTAPTAKARPLSVPAVAAAPSVRAGGRATASHSAPERPVILAASQIAAAASGLAAATAPSAVTRSTRNRHKAATP